MNKFLLILLVALFVISCFAKDEKEKDSSYDGKPQEYHGKHDKHDKHDSYGKDKDSYDKPHESHDKHDKHDKHDSYGKDKDSYDKPHESHDKHDKHDKHDSYGKDNDSYDKPHESHDKHDKHDKHDSYGKHKHRRVFRWKVVNVVRKLDGDGSSNNPSIVTAIDDGTGVPQSPGPQVVVNKGDRVEFIVTNDTPFPLSIHWHGFEQRGTAWADGTSGITQWEIPSRSSYVYKFKANLVGTFFYHGFGTQTQADGLVGSFIVKDDKHHKKSPYHHHYNTDEVLLFHSQPERNSIGGFLDYLAQITRAEKSYQAEVTTPFTKLLNGHTAINPYITTIRRGTTRRFRVINGDHQSDMFFTIEGHSFSVIALDTEYIKEKTFAAGEYVHLANGQRVDILLTANQFPGNFRLRAVTRSADFVSGILNYEGVDKTDALPEKAAIPSPIVYSNTDFEPYYATEMPKGDWGFQQQVNISYSGFSDGIVYNGPTVRTRDLHWAASINGKRHRRFVYPDVPTIFNPKRTKVNKIDVKLGTVVDLIVFNEDFIAHPYHIHGYHFWELGRGVGPFDVTKLNFENPIRRDVFELEGATRCTAADNGLGDCVFNVSPPCLTTGTACNKKNPQLGGKTPSWTAFRIHFDHEGPWLGSCHITSHLKLGYANVFVVSKDSEHFHFKIPEDIPRSTFRRIKERKDYDDYEERGHEDDKKKRAATVQTVEKPAI